MGAPAKFFALGWRDRGLVMAASCALAGAWIGLRTAGFDAVQRAAAGSRTSARGSYAWCGPPPRQRRTPPPVERIAWAVRAAGEYFPGGGNCLVRALATQALLTRYGYAAQLRIGVRKADDGGLAAHAWLEAGGAVVIGDFAVGEYTALVASSGRQSSMEPMPVSGRNPPGDAQDAHGDR